MLSTCVPPPLGYTITRPDLSGANVRICPWGSVRAAPFALRVVPDTRAAEEWCGMALAVRVREPAARTRGVVVVVVVGVVELGE